MSRTLWLPGRPVPAARPRFDSRTGRAYTSRRYEEWKERAVLEVRSSSPGPAHSGPVETLVDVTAEGIAVRVVPLRRRFRPKGLRGDLDNYLKAALDALVEADVLEDDRHVESIDARFFGDREENS